MPRSGTRIQRFGRANRGSVREFQLGFEISTQAEQHDVGRRRRGEDRIPGSAANGAFWGSSGPDERGTQ